MHRFIYNYITHFNRHRPRHIHVSRHSLFINILNNHAMMHDNNNILLILVTKLYFIA